jgi:hypothetical protein
MSEEQRARNRDAAEADHLALLLQRDAQRLAGGEAIGQNGVPLGALEPKERREILERVRRVGRAYHAQHPDSDLAERRHAMMRALEAGWKAARTHEEVRADKGRGKALGEAIGRDPRAYAVTVARLALRMSAFPEKADVVGDDVLWRAIQASAKRGRPKKAAGDDSQWTEDSKWTVNNDLAKALGCYAERPETLRVEISRTKQRKA